MGWGHSPYADRIVQREGRTCWAGPQGTPREPRTVTHRLRAASGHFPRETPLTARIDGKPLPDLPLPPPPPRTVRGVPSGHLPRELVRQGYYDAYRKAFEEAEE